MNVPANILIVDDEPANRRLLENILKREGFTTCCAENGKECLDRVRVGGVDLVLLDVMMPVLDGVSACRAIREELRLPLLPVLLVTALNDRGSRTRGKQAGADDFITKPIYQEELLARVRVLLSVRRYQAELELARRRLTGLLVHDLKNPLGVIRLNLEHLREHAPEDEAGELRGAIEDALAGAAQIQRMLVDMLDVGLAEEGRLPFAPTAKDIGAVVESASQSCRAVVERRGARLEVRLAAERPTVSCDESLLVRALQNLIGNAARYVPSGGLVEVSMQVHPATVIVTVGNEGSSILPEQKDRLFEKFGRVTSGQTGENRGLGLYLCRLVAERHGGSIAVRDREGGGVCFDVALPRDQSAVS